MLEGAREGRHERLRASARKGDEIIVPLSRSAGEKLPMWGLEFDVKTMALVNCIDGSSASRSALSYACVSLVLSRIDDAPIRNLGDVLRKMGGCSSLKLQFYPADITPSVPDMPSHMMSGDGLALGRGKRKSLCGAAAGMIIGNK